ncbi:Ribonuclease/ribotoxin [Aspergillus aculeatinus CBS 121060]|uniref:Ribonuclease/ribotoxin n=1 Tax=Aspergillus aculeatinus CBS 121060 TaxID=1448322 RepID=A0ACD1HF93_9EURO|nr:Ribonuclease/ribotoxin [Aspergillus aculeatinus CBS 121060]RAH72518.1 Ribonuclease/ribotoxin [Aspergillus aculeatinus CBS 121060]
MRVSIKSLFVAFLALSSVACHPIAKSPMQQNAEIIDISERDLDARARIRPVNCGGQRFDGSDINGARRQAWAVHEAKARNSYGYNKYPEWYENHEKLFVSTSDLYEYPLTSGGVYSGKGDAGVGHYRVVVNEHNKYMGAMYHPTGLDNRFKLCDVE